MTATPAALYFDFTSPSSVVAASRLEAVRRNGADVSFVGIDILGLAIAVPAPASLHAACDAWHDAATTHGVPLTPPTWLPPTLKAHLLTRLAATPEHAHQWRTAVFRAYFVHGLAIDDDTVLRRLARDCDFPAADVASLLDDPQPGRELAHKMALNRKRGIGDVPVLEVHGSFLSPHVSDTDLAALLMVTL